MTDFRAIYATQAEQYDRMVSREDYQGNLWKALRAIKPFAGLEIVELGAGTGRLTLPLAAEARSIIACDSSAHMLAVTQRKLTQTGLTNWRTVVCDNGALPLLDRAADMVIAGWSLGHAVGWYPDRWHDVIGAALNEMRRVLRPGGALIIFETLGTGTEVPTPPHEGLAAYYRHLETAHGFSRMAIRTDYRFESPEEGDHLTRFFFGDAPADRIRAERLTILPECTGLWWRES